MDSLEVELARLAEHLRAVVEGTMQPESVTLWLKGQPGGGLEGH